MVLLSTAVPATTANGSVADMWNGLGADRPHPAVVRVVVSEGETMSLGSGTLVATRGRHGLVVTNWHVVRDARGPINVIFPDGFRSGASLLGTDADWDLAALAIWRPNVEPVQLSKHAPQLDEPLSIAGYGSGKYRSASGRCVQYISPGGNHPFEMLELSAAARDGDSGGPIFNDQGELAGVLFGAARGRTAGSYCGRVKWFLNSVSARFDALSSPPSDTMIAQDLPTPAVTSELAASPSRVARRTPMGPPANDVAMERSRPPADYAWEPTVEEAYEPEPERESPRRRALPLASIPAPLIDPPTASSESDTDNQVEPAFPTGFPVAPAPAFAASANLTDPPQPSVQEDPRKKTAEAELTPLEQAKNFLAAFGLVMIVFQVLKVVSAIQNQTTRKRRRAPARRRTTAQPQVRRRVVRRVRSW